MLLETLETTDGCGIKKQKKKAQPLVWKRHQPYGPGAGKRMEMLRVLSSLLLTRPVKGIWGYMVIAEGVLGRRSYVTAFICPEKQEFDVGTGLP